MPVSSKRERRKPVTPRSRIKGALRKLWLYSRERHAALKRDGNTCLRCKRKASVAKGRQFKVEVHHKPGIQNWEEIYRAVYAYLLCDPKHLETLCSGCHKRVEGRL